MPSHLSAGASQEVGFSLQKELSVPECTQLVEQLDAKGHRRLVALPDLTLLVSGLSSGVPYEFRVAAVNDIGAQDRK
jgi:hypothetical protein